MRKIGTVVALALAGTLAVATALPVRAEAASTSLYLHAGKFSKKKPSVGKKNFRYLDMVQRTHPSSIRNAVIVYDYGLKKGRCEADQNRSISACLRGPST